MMLGIRTGRVERLRENCEVALVMILAHKE
jgi:hypothetical protein